MEQLEPDAGDILAGCVASGIGSLWWTTRLLSLPEEAARHPTEEAAAPTEAAAEEKPPPRRPQPKQQRPQPALMAKCRRCDAYPLPPELDLGGSTVEKMPIDQLVKYEALPEYHEPEWVTALVDAAHCLGSGTSAG